MSIVAWSKVFVKCWLIETMTGKDISATVIVTLRLVPAGTLAVSSMVRVAIIC